VEIVSAGLVIARVLAAAAVSGRLKKFSKFLSGPSAECDQSWEEVTG
jgi:hypothetical protein